MPKDIRLLGWELEFYDITNDVKYKSEIIDLAISQDINTCVVKCKIKFLVDSTFLKYFSKPHDGKLYILNKMVYTDEVEELYSIDLESITNVGSIIVRESDTSQSQLIPVSINYYCKKGITLLNKRVGKIYHKKKLEEIVQDLYKQTECDLELKLEKFDNQTQYPYIYVAESSFIDNIRYLNQHFGFYNSELLMFGETFTDSEINWTLNNISKLSKDREEIKLIFTPYEQRGRKVKPITEKEYHTYIPINIKNGIESISKRLPMQIKYVAFDNDKFIKRKDISVSDTINEIDFLSSNKQFDENLTVKSEMMYGSRFDMKDYTIKNALQSLGLSAYSMPIQIPNPFLLEHFKIGTIINFESQIEENINSFNIKLIVLGWLLRIKQGTGKGSGGGSYNGSLIVRVAATSYLEKEESEE